MVHKRFKGDGLGCATIPGRRVVDELPEGVAEAEKNIRRKYPSGYPKIRRLRESGCYDDVVRTVALCGCSIEEAEAYVVPREKVDRAITCRGEEVLRAFSWLKEGSQDRERGWGVVRNGQWYEGELRTKGDIGVYVEASGRVSLQNHYSEARSGFLVYSRTGNLEDAARNFKRVHGMELVFKEDL